MSSRANTSKSYYLQQVRDIHKRDRPSYSDWSAQKRHEYNERQAVKMAQLTNLENIRAQADPNSGKVYFKIGLSKEPQVTTPEQFQKIRQMEGSRAKILSKDRYDQMINRLEGERKGSVTRFENGKRIVYQKRGDAKPKIFYDERRQTAAALGLTGEDIAAEVQKQGKMDQKKVTLKKDSLQTIADRKEQQRAQQEKQYVQDIKEAVRAGYQIQYTPDDEITKQAVQEAQAERIRRNIGQKVGLPPYKKVDDKLPGEPGFILTFQNSQISGVTSPSSSVQFNMQPGETPDQALTRFQQMEKKGLGYIVFYQKVEPPQTNIQKKELVSYINTAPGPSTLGVAPKVSLAKRALGSVEGALVRTFSRGRYQSLREIRDVEAEGSLPILKGTKEGVIEQAIVAGQSTLGVIKIVRKYERVPSEKLGIGDAIGKAEQALSRKGDEYFSKSLFPKWSRLDPSKQAADSKVNEINKNNSSNIPNKSSPVQDIDRNTNKFINILGFIGSGSKKVINTGAGIATEVGSQTLKFTRIAVEEPVTTTATLYGGAKVLKVGGKVLSSTGRAVVPKFISQAAAPYAQRAGVVTIAGGFATIEAVQSDKPGRTFVGTATGFMAAEKGIRNLPRVLPKFGTVSLPTTKGSKTAYKGLYLEPKKGTAVQIAGVTDDGLTIGRATVREKLMAIPEGAEIKPNTALETQILSDTLAKIGTTERAKQALPLGRRIIRNTQGVKSKFITNKNLKTERLNEEQTEALLLIARQEGGVVFGSGARRVQVPESISSFQPRDIDIRLQDASPKNVARVRDKAYKLLQERGAEVRLAKDMPEAIEVKTPEGWRKAVEFKGPGQIDNEIVPENVLGFTKEGKIIRVGDNRFTALEEELRGVTQGVFRVRKSDGKIDVFPSPKRIKDISSVDISAETLLQSRRPGIKRMQLKQDLELFRKLYGRDSIGDDATTILADFSPKRIPRVKGGSPSYASSATASKNIQSAIARVNKELSSSISPKQSKVRRVDMSIISGSPDPRSPVSGLSPVARLRSPQSKQTSPTTKQILADLNSPTVMEKSSTSSKILIERSVMGPQSKVSSANTIISSLTRSPGTRQTKKQQKNRFIVRFDRDKKLQGAEPGYDVQVKEKGKWIKANKNPVSKENAESIGSYVVDNSASASYRVKKTSKDILQQPNRSSLYQLLQGKFRQQKNNKKVRVEKNVNRIDTAGELQGITAKGIIANMQKRNALNIMGNEPIKKRPARKSKKKPSKRKR